MRWIILGALSGAGVGLGLATWYLLILPPPAKESVGLNAHYVEYFLTRAMILAFISSIPGAVIGALVALVAAIVEWCRPRETNLKSSGGTDENALNTSTPNS